MATWKQFEDETGEFAAAVRARFDASRHHVLATLRLDGSPRVSGTEVRFDGDDLTIGSMWAAMKALDLRRDGLFALHANPGDGSMRGGDAKLAGRAIEVSAPGTPRSARSGGHAADSATREPDRFHQFRLELTEVVLTSIGANDDHLEIRSWRPGESVRRVERR